MDLPGLYNMVFKRKSIRKFNQNLSVSNEELTNLKREINELKPLIPGINVRIEIVDRKQTSAKRGEYCLLFYSDEKPCYLQNAGYMLEQIDLFLTSCNIGVCWYGVAKPKEMYNKGLKYIVMLAFGKCHPDDFRKNISEFSRKNEKTIWPDNFFPEIAKVVQLAPSGCNLQPWRIYSKQDEIKVYRHFSPESFPAKKQAFYQETDFSLIDMGICLCFLEISLLHNGFCFNRIINQSEDSRKEIMEIATYQILKKQ